MRGEEKGQGKQDEGTAPGLASQRPDSLGSSTVSVELLPNLGSASMYLNLIFVVTCVPHGIE